MNALVKKEIRLLLPSFLIGLAAACLMWLALLKPNPDLAVNCWGTLPVVLSFLICPAMVAMLSLDSFGREMTARTFPLLLAQPVPRVRVWRVKTSLLAASILTIWAVWLAGFLMFVHFTGPKLLPADYCKFAAGSLLLALAVYSGGLWTVLLLRQVAVAFWFTLLVPTSLLVTVIHLLDKHPKNINPTLVVLFILYSVAGFLFARWLFLRAQDAQWTGGTIELPELRGLKWWGERPREPQTAFDIGSSAASPHRTRRPLAAMFAREFQLHQSQLIIAAGLALLHLGAIATRIFAGGFTSYPVMEFILEQFWWLWLAMPVLVGCAAVAEERRLGTLEGQHCLPARRRTQFAVKRDVVLLLSVLLGMVMPLLLEGTRILPNLHLNADSYSIPNLWSWGLYSGAETIQVILIWLALISDWLGCLMFAAICAASGAISFYCSTLARNTLQSLGPAVLGIYAAAFMLEAGCLPENYINYPLWRGWLAYLIGVPVLMLTTAWLAYWNYQHVLVGWNVLRRNVLTLAAALAVVVLSTTALYHRVWERLTTLDPPHGAVRLASSQRVTLQFDEYRLTVIFPDGRVRLSYLSDFNPSLWAMLAGDRQMKEVFGGGRFLDGTNWTSVAKCNFDTVGIQKDGSLWVSEKPGTKFYVWRNGQSRTLEPAQLVQLGDDNDWKCVVRDGLNALLLKNDGTLWRLGGTNQLRKASQWPGLRAFKPERVGTDSDWAEFYYLSDWLCLRKTDGRTWSNIRSFSSPNDPDKNDAITVGNYTLYRVPFMDQHHWQGAAWVSSPRGRSFLVGVRDDGTFRVMAQWQPSPKRNSTWELATQDIPLGQETNWLAVAGNPEITLKADGSLWRWTFADDPTHKPGSATVTRLGTHSDWVAIAEKWGCVVSLAADGSLWCWRFEREHVYARALSILPLPLFGVSRKPQKIANIFEAPDLPKKSKP